MTFRKLEGIQRLAEASARVRLSETVEMQDVHRACELVGESMRQVGVDSETNEFDVDPIETGTSKAQHDRIHIVERIIAGAADEGTVGAPIDVVRKRAVTKGISESKIEYTIQKLKNEARVFKPTGGELLPVRD